MTEHEQRVIDAALAFRINSGVTEKFDLFAAVDKLPGGPFLQTALDAVRQPEPPSVKGFGLCKCGHVEEKHHYAQHTAYACESCMCSDFTRSSAGEVYQNIPIRESNTAASPPSDDGLSGPHWDSPLVVKETGLVEILAIVIKAFNQRDLDLRRELLALRAKLEAK